MSREPHNVYEKKEKIFAYLSESGRPVLLKYLELYKRYKKVV